MKTQYDFEGYTIFNTGVVLNPDGDEVGSMDAKGHKIVGIAGYNYRVHRLVARIFAPEKYYHRVKVKHKDKDGRNNHIDNLVIG